MEVIIKDLKGKNTSKKLKLPSQFDEELRPDLIKKAVLCIRANKRQPYGASSEAGKRHSAKISRRRRKYRGSYGHGISRVPRKILSRNGTRMNWVGALAPGTVGGRRAHPPKASKILSQKINKKEKRFAIRSAMSASVVVDIVKKRGHIVPNEYPIVVDSDIEKLKKTKEVVETLIHLGLKDELLRVQRKSIRAGKGTMRNRKYKKLKGPLLVTGDDCVLNKSARNITGIDIVKVNNLNTELLAPGTNPGRLTIYTQSAIEKIDENKFFTDNIVKDDTKIKVKKVIEVVNNSKSKKTN